MNDFARGPLNCLSWSVVLFWRNENWGKLHVMESSLIYQSLHTFSRIRQKTQCCVSCMKWPIKTRNINSARRSLDFLGSYVYLGQSFPIYFNGFWYTVECFCPPALHSLDVTLSFVLNNIRTLTNNKTHATCRTIAEIYGLVFVLGSHKRPNEEACEHFNLQE